MLLSLTLSVLATQVQTARTFKSNDVEVAVVRSDHEYLLEFFTVGPKKRLILVSPTHPKARPSVQTRRNSIGSGGGVFNQAPTFRFEKLLVHSSKSFELSAMVPELGPRATIRQTFELPLGDGGVINTRVSLENARTDTRLQYLLASYAFVPDGTLVSPDETFAPALRPGASDVIGDHFFRAPFVFSRKNSLSAALIGDLTAIARDRVMPMIIDLDAQSGVTKATLLSYGFCDHRVSGHVRFRTDSMMTRKVPASTSFSFKIRLSGKDRTVGSVQKAMNTYFWNTIGKQYFDRGLPQVLPYKEYPRISYTAAMNEQYGNNVLGWFEHEIDGNVCGGIPSGWGFREGWVSWQCWFNQLRSAWGMYFWGSQLRGNDWKDRAAKMLNLALAAPLDRGACPTTYLSREKKWKGTLIAPTPDCYYDLTNMAWKGIWLIRFADEFDDCPRVTEIANQCVQMANCMIRNQNRNGSIPTWLTKDHQQIGFLAQSAQSALPAWFMFELAESKKLNISNEVRESLRKSALRVCDFLLRSVTNGAYYYDFETFFSCSPKICLQNGSQTEHDAMRDPHTLQPPQNTLCMQWSAEALIRAHLLTRDERYKTHALAALDQMITYQNVWTISYRHVANTFGGFGVQNSDGEYLDARQAQFGSTLCDFGASLGRKDLFERGVAAVRASMTLVHHPLHIENGLYRFPNYPYGLMPENCGHGGADMQDGRTGFDWGEGSSCAAMAEITHKYGGAYVDVRNKWAVGIDAVKANDSGTQFQNLLWQNNAPFTGALRITPIRSDGKKAEQVLAEPWPVVRRITPSIRDGKRCIEVILGWQSTKNEAPDIRAFAIYSGQRIPLSVDARGLYGVLPSHFISDSVRVEGTADGKPIASDSFPVRFDADFFNKNESRFDWWFTGNVPEVPTYSTRTFFGNDGLPFIGTCEDGLGGFNDGFIFNALSPAFLVTKSKISLRVGGGAGPGVYVELIRKDTQEQLAIARGTNSEVLKEHTWNVHMHRGELLQIRVVDRETGPWGHINLSRIRSHD